MPLYELVTIVRSQMSSVRDIDRGTSAGAVVFNPTDPIGRTGSVVAAHAVQAQLADLVRKSVYIVLDNHGVVRRIENLGVKTLPYAMRAHMTKFDVGR